MGGAVTTNADDGQLGGIAKIAPVKINGMSSEVLTALADALEIDLTVTERGDIFGTDEHRIVCGALGLKKALPVRVESNFASANGEDVGILVSTQGDLYLLAFASTFDRVVKVAVIDRARSKLKKMASLFEEEGVRTWRSAVKLLGDGIIRVYARDFGDEGAWQRREEL